MAAGLGFKTFTSGEVLTAADTNGYLMQGILVFANASARSAAITSPQEGQYSSLKDTNSTEYYDGSAWVAGVEGDISGVTAGVGISGGGTSGTVTVTNSMATTITSKGDLVPGTGSGTFARLAVGNNGETLIADSSTSTGLRYTGNYAAGKNAVLNSDFSIWQRSTSISYTGSGATTFTADRCSVYANGNGTFTFSRQTFTPGAAPVAGYEGQYFYRSTTNTLGTSTAIYYLQNNIENVQTFAGQTVTLSFWAKSDAARTLNLALTQVFGTGGSSSVAVTSSVSVTTSWARYSYTVALASISGKTIGTGSYLQVRLDGVPTASQTMDIWGLQLENGSVATAFQTATGTLQGELAACQRYYYRVYPNTSGRYSTGQCTSTTTATFWTPYPVTMRTTPTALEQSGTATDYRLQDSAGNGVTCSSVPVFQIATTAGGSSVFTVATGIVAGNGTIGFAANANSYLGWSAEL